MSDDDFDAAAAAARAVGDEPDVGGAVDDVQEASGDATDPTSRTSTSRSDLQDALMSTDPDTPLEDVESPWNPELGGPSRIYRGFQKITGFDRLPAIADIGIGALETWKAHFVVDDGAEDASADGGSDADDGGDVDLEDAGPDGIPGVK